MKIKTYPFIGGIFLLVIVFLVGRCSAPSIKDSHAEHENHSTAVSTLWTCSMHPQIQQEEFGNCPICGMELIPLASETTSENPRSLTMSSSAKALAEIETSLVKRRFPEAEIRLVGKLDYDETKVKSLSARFPARIEDLYVNYVGVPVSQGDHLAQIYSPELLSAQSELLSAYRYDPQSAATRAAQEKLRLWGLLPDQIDAVTSTGVPSDNFELKAPISGIVVQKNVTEGDYIKTGEPLFKIVDLTELWLQLQAYETDLVWLRFGQSVTFEVEAFPGETFSGIIAFIEPELDRKTRTVSVRVNVPNPDRKLKPGMFAKANVLSKIASSNSVYAPEFAGKWISPMHPEIVKDGPGDCDVCGMDLVPAEQLGYVQNPDAKAPLVIPATAVLRTGKRAVVYVENENTEFPNYEGRSIELGPRAGAEFIVASGLKEGDRVVTHGAFKIDSALQIQGKPSMMKPAYEEPSLSLDLSKAKAILPHYLTLQKALAKDDLIASREAIDALQKEGAKPLSLQGTSSIDSIRSAFESLSIAVLEIVSENPDDFAGSLYKMHCPMAFDGRGADWLQSDDQLRNPYFGSSMLTCGTIEGKF